MAQPEHQDPQGDRRSSGCALAGLAVLALFLAVLGSCALGSSQGLAILGLALVLVVVTVAVWLNVAFGGRE